MAKLFVISGPSGVGKGTLIKHVLMELPATHLAVSACTRTPRPGEIHGTHYYFMDEGTFQNKISSDHFAEWCEVHGNYYGTLRDEINSYRDKGVDVIVEIDTQGAQKLREVYPGLVSLFVAPPSMKDLQTRLNHRNTDDQETIAKRLKVAQKELDEIANYDYIVVNQNINDSVNAIIDVIKLNR